jgi:hypothetical protein
MNLWNRRETHFVAMSLRRHRRFSCASTSTTCFGALTTTCTHFLNTWF